MKLKSSRISGTLGAIAIATSTLFMSGYSVSACGCNCQCNTANTDGQSGGSAVVVGDNTIVYGDIVVNGSSSSDDSCTHSSNVGTSNGDNITQTVPVFSCVPEVIDAAVGVHIKDTLEMNGMETTYGFVVGSDTDENCYTATLAESEYQKYVNAEDETAVVKVYKVTVQQDSSSRGVFERYSFPWKPEDRTFTEAEMAELKGLIESGASYEIEEIKNKYGLDYCKIDENAAGVGLLEQEEPMDINF